MCYKVLVVDDNDDTRDLFAAVLADAGYVVVTAETVGAGMQALADEAPDAAIVDVRLNGSNGLQLAALSRRPIPMAVVTGFPDKGLELEAREMGMEYLLKPVLPSTLVATVRRMLESRTEGPSR